MCTGEANYFRDYKRLRAFAKLATSYLSTNDFIGIHAMKAKAGTVSRGENFVCNILTNILNILTPAVFMAPTTLSQTRLVEESFKLIGKFVNLCGFLTDCIAYGDRHIRHCSVLLWEGIPCASGQRSFPYTTPSVRTHTIPL